MRNYSENRESNSRVITGLIILVVGVLFLVNNFHWLPPQVGYYLFSWKTLLIGIGVLNLLLSRNRVTGFILITVGVAFWAPQIFHLPIPVGRLIWPMAIIAVGLFLLVNRREEGRGNGFFGGHRSADENAADGKAFVQEDFIDDVAIFGGGDRVVTSKNFRGGKLTAIFGGSAIRMHRASMAPGKHYLEVFYMFGGSEIVVPADWVIRVDVVSIFGGFSDKRYVRKPEEITDENHPVLVIKGLVIFGGGEIKTY